MALFMMVGGGLVAAVTFALWQQGGGSPLDVIGAGGIALVGLGIFLLNRGGHERTAGLILCLLLLLVPIYYVLLEGPKCTALLLLVGSVVYADFLLGGYSGIYAALLACFLYAGAGLAHQQGWFSQAAYLSPLAGDVFTLAFVCFALAFTAGYFTRELRRALQALREQERALHSANAEKEHILAEIAAREEVQRRLLEQVHELGSPIIPLSEGVIAMPIIGLVNGERAEEIATALLRGVEAYRARVAIVDITGVPVVDAPFGAALLRMAEGVRLLGAEPVLTGVRPAVAEALIDLGLERKVTCQATLREGLDYAVRQRRAEAWAPAPVPTAGPSR